jgi:methionyl-tRNA synthetase
VSGFSARLRFARSFHAVPQALQKPYYVTTPIFYVNAGPSQRFQVRLYMDADLAFSTEPHIGHLHSLVLADVLKRYRHLRYGEHEPKPVLLTGTDEHGMKIQKAAQGQGVTPAVLCDRVSQRFEALARAANVDYDVFYRTTNPQHVKVVQDVWVGLRYLRRLAFSQLSDIILVAAASREGLDLQSQLRRLVFGFR